MKTLLRVHTHAQGTRRDYSGAERLYQRILNVDRHNTGALTDYATMISSTDPRHAAELFET
jgi:hypothetical protein